MSVPDAILLVVSAIGIQSFAEDAADYLMSRMSAVPPYSASEYFAALLGRAAQALKDGDYGISAALVVRYPDVELISLARNTVISRCDPMGHAETNAIRQFRKFLDGGPGASSPGVLPWEGPASAAASGHGLYVRPPAPGEAEGAVMYATLEPCPMCTVAILNSRIKNVVIAFRDELGGALASQRLAGLPAIWPAIATAQHLNVNFTDSGDMSALETYVPPSLSALLERAFLDTKDAIDAKLTRGTLFAPGTHAKLKGLLELTWRDPA
jgi:tRNA(Arg) A34 adenosine deaminase TadA